MTTLKQLSVILLLLTLAISCKKSSSNIQATGIIQQQGITTYQYGTHVMPGYALRSSTIDLDTYVGQNVTVVGHLVDGYPVENGPDYLEVEEVL